MRCNNSLAVKKCGVVSLDLGDGVRSLAPDVQHCGDEELPASKDLCLMARIAGPR
jgi:hypothetical protein